MLRFFFNRTSKFVRMLELTGSAGFIAVFLSGDYFQGTLFFRAMFLVLLIEYLFIIFCAVWKWYRDHPAASSEAGIGLQFQKARVPAAYIIVIANALALYYVSGPLLVPFVVLLLLVGHLNAILLYLHLRDRDETPPNYFSAGGGKVTAV